MNDHNIYWRFRNKHEPLGEFGERLWKQVMLDCGFFYIQLSTLPALNGNGPRLQGSDAILPDFEINGQRRAYMDSKAKTAPVLYRNANELRHGIDRKCLEAYEAISGINRQKCALGIVELFDEDETTWSGTLLIQTLGVLGSPIRGFSNQDHMVYWPRRSFVEIASYREMDLWQIASGEAKASEETKVALRAFFARPDPPIQGRFT